MVALELARAKEKARVENQYPKKKNRNHNGFWATHLCVVVWPRDALINFCYPHRCEFTRGRQPMWSRWFDQLGCVRQGRFAHPWGKLVRVLWQLCVRT